MGNLQLRVWHASFACCHILRIFPDSSNFISEQARRKQDVVESQRIMPVLTALLSPLPGAETEDQVQFGVWVKSAAPSNSKPPNSQHFDISRLLLCEQNIKTPETWHMSQVIMFCGELFAICSCV